MTVRNRIFITALLLCHLVVWHSLVTSQLRPAQPVPTEEVTIEADQQEKIGEIYNLRGHVHIHFRGYDLRADEIIYNSSTGDVTASGTFFSTVVRTTSTYRARAAPITSTVKTENFTTWLEPLAQR
jgi:lipopolysaccharide assembly outer membrane protein LptD (OstA)